MIQQRGIDGAKALYERVKKDDPQPFSAETLTSTANWFGWQKDEDFKIRRGLFEIYVDSYPRSARGHFGLANACRGQSDRECAREQYEHTLRLLPADSDWTLDAAARTRMETMARGRLAEVR